MGLAAIPIGMGAAGALSSGIQAAAAGGEADKRNKLRAEQIKNIPWTGRNPDARAESPSMFGSIIGGGTQGALSGYNIMGDITKAAEDKAFKDKLLGISKSGAGTSSVTSPIAPDKLNVDNTGSALGGALSSTPLIPLKAAPFMAANFGGGMSTTDPNYPMGDIAPNYSPINPFMAQYLYPFGAGVVQGSPFRRQ